MASKNMALKPVITTKLPFKKMVPHATKYYSALKRMEILTHAMWMNLGEINQTKRTSSL